MEERLPFAHPNDELHIENEIIILEHRVVKATTLQSRLLKELQASYIIIDKLLTQSLRLMAHV